MERPYRAAHDQLGGRREPPGSLRKAAGSRRDDLHVVLEVSVDRLREYTEVVRRAASGKADVQAMLSSAARLREMADTLKEQAVRQARGNGWSWEAIGQSLGITKQAAHQQYSELIQ